MPHCWDVDSQTVTVILHGSGLVLVYGPLEAAGAEEVTTFTQPVGVISGKGTRDSDGGQGPVLQILPLELGRETCRQMIIMLGEVWGGFL